MNRRRFFAALLALPFVPKALETLASASTPAPAAWEAVTFQSSLAFDLDSMDAAAFNAHVARLMDDIRRDIENAILNGET